jgi:NAD(P)-dependent dehydrogenase (short-subunit alcohol dehydrogenase family)
VLADAGAARLAGRVAIVTGAGCGLGRAHALCLAAHGASIVVNDVGGEPGPARVVEEIEALGGWAAASAHDVADWEQSAELVRIAVETFGDLHVLVNNAGIVRDRTLAKLSEEEWDAVVRVNLKGHAAPTRHAMAYWKGRAAAARSDRSVIHTSSGSALVGLFGQANYGAAKAGLLGLSNVVATEGRRLGVRSNVIAPLAATRMAQTLGEAMRPSSDPASVSPLVAWLAQPQCPATGQLFHFDGSRLLVLAPATITHELHSPGVWTVDELDATLPPRLVERLGVGDLLEVAR